MRANPTQRLAAAWLAGCMIAACGPSPVQTASSPLPGLSPAAPSTETPSPAPPPSFTPPPTDTPLPTGTPTATPMPIMESLKARVVTGDPRGLLSCRYGPGPEYLYLYALRETANIILIGRTDGNNWVYVEGKNKCWVNARFLEIAGERLSLPVVYPGTARVPVSPYYPPTDWVGATRTGNLVEVSWNAVPLRAGDEEDEFMLHYIVEVWRCEGGRVIFDPLATNDLAISFVDEPGCTGPSHGRVFVQEKHGFAGPTEIPWPAPP